MIMRVLVTGGAGFVGARVVEKLLACEHDVVVFSRRLYSSSRKNDHKLVKVAGDIRFFSDVMRAVANRGLDAIIHVAYALTAESEANPHWAAEVNILGTCNIFEAARIAQVKRVVFCSSIAAYAPQELYGNRPVTEDEVLLKSSSIYGTTKALNEFMAGKFEAKYGTENVCVRISAVYGTGREARGVTAWTSDMVAAAVKHESVVVPIRADQASNFIYVDDVAEQLVRLASAHKLHYRLYNSGGTRSTPSEFASVVKKYYPNADIRFDENAAPWPYPYEVDGTRLEREIGFKPRDPESGLLEQINKERALQNLPPLQRLIESGNRS